MHQTLFKSLYVHFPFCEVKCHYCDFYSLGREKTNRHDHQRFSDALTAEVALWQDQWPQDGFETIFFGGGTPSMTAPKVMAEAFSNVPLALSSRSNFSSGGVDSGEWTMEANPSSIQYSTMVEYRALGVNRISMGVQSTHDQHLKTLGRVHSSTQAFQALDSVFTAGFRNVSVDLICGVPGQTLGEIEFSLKALTAFPITHMSVYLLTLPKAHNLYSQLPDEDGQLAHLLFVHEWLSGQGFEHYEISNFCLPGYRAKHNLNYWQGSSYLGLGPSAHSFSAENNHRWRNAQSLHRYADLLKDQKKPIDWEEFLTVEQMEIERWMLTLRLSDGFPKDWVKVPKLHQKTEKLGELGLLEEHPHDLNRWRLTAKGFALSEQVIREYL